MATNLNLDDKLINKAKRLGRHKTKRDAVTAALQEYVRQRERLSLLDLVGQVDYWPDYDYKELRRRSAAKRIPKDDLD